MISSSIRIALTIVVLGVGPARAAELVMFERAGCVWCERFNAEIGRIYDKTDEGAKAKLRRVDLGQAMPADLSQIKAAPFTPTFVLIEDGKEIGRIEGYPGENFFFGYLDNLLAKLDRTKSAAALSN